VSQATVKMKKMVRKMVEEGARKHPVFRAGGSEPNKEV
jgi:hypothetical protein